MDEVMDPETGEVVDAATIQSGLLFTVERLGILKKMQEVKRSISGSVLRRNARNKELGNSYADINAVLELLEPALIESNVLAVEASFVLPGGWVAVKTDLIDLETDQQVSKIIHFKPTSYSPQIMCGLETYGRRYNFAGLFNLILEDDDGNLASGVTGKTSGKKQDESTHKTTESAQASTPVQEPTKRQLEKAREIAQEQGCDVPDEVVADRLVCSAFITKLVEKAKQQGDGQGSNGAHRPATGSSERKLADARDNARNGSQTTAKGASDMSQAEHTASSYIRSASLDEMERCRSLVKGHKVLTMAEKERCIHIIESRLIEAQMTQCPPPEAAIG